MHEDDLIRSLIWVTETTQSSKLVLDRPKYLYQDTMDFFSSFIEVSSLFVFNSINAIKRNISLSIIKIKIRIKNVFNVYFRIINLLKCILYNLNDQ